jgi:hypothetical protein
VRKAAWTLTCIAAAAGTALAFWYAAWTAVYRRLPHLAQMEAGCAVDGAARAQPASAPVSAAMCERYFADAGLLRRTATTQSVITGVIVAFILLVLRFRVRPLGAPPRPPPRRDPP